MNKRKIFKIILWLSFAPYLFLIGDSLYHAIFGYKVYTMFMHEYVKTYYGWEAFFNDFVWTGLALCFTLIIPVCFLYQIIYLIVRMNKSQNW